ncbi:MAG: DUF3108 domain-containing protein [Gemmatimonadota bacterium]
MKYFLSLLVSALVMAGLGPAPSAWAQDVSTEAAVPRFVPAAERLPVGTLVRVPGEPEFQAPWRVGEYLEYELRMSPLGRVARATFSVQAGEAVQGVPTVRFHSRVRGRVLLAPVEKDNLSWVDPRTMVSLRYESQAREFTFRKHDRVDIRPAEGVWVEEFSGDTGPLPSAWPVDQLALLYYARGLPLNVGDSIRITRYFRVYENPVEIRVLRREEVEVPAGTFPALVVEIHFAPRRRFEDGGTTTLYLSDDPRRLLLRMETPVPIFGTVDMRLTGFGRPVGG